MSNIVAILSAVWHYDKNKKQTCWDCWGFQSFERVLFGDTGLINFAFDNWMFVQLPFLEKRGHQGANFPPLLCALNAPLIRSIWLPATVPLSSVWCLLGYYGVCGFPQSQHLSLIRGLVFHNYNKSLCENFLLLLALKEKLSILFAKKIKWFKTKFYNIYTRPLV